MKGIKNLISLVLAISLMALTFSACNDTSSSEATGSEGESSTEIVKDDTVIIATQNEPPNLSPVDHDSLSGVYMNLLTYNGLIKIDYETLDPVYDLAESHTVSEDGLAWTFKLKEGVKFHDGTDFTASDVVASINWAKSYPASSTYTSKMTSVEAADDYTVVIKTEKPYAGLLFDLGYHFNMIVPEELIAAEHNFEAEPIGTGPYKFVDWVSGDSITFVKNEDYFDKDNMPTITNMIWRIIPEGTSRTIALETGEVDFVYEVESADLPRLMETEGIVVQEKTSVENWFMSLNGDKEPFNDVNFRKAITTAIDREAIVLGALNGYGIESISAISQGYKESTTAGAEGYDLEKAKEYLAAWGGDPSTVTIPIICSNDLKVRIATIIQANLREIGITVEIVTMDFATYLDAVSGTEYTSAIQSWSPSNALTYLQRYHSDRRNANPGFLNDPEVDALVRQAETTIDPTEREAIMHDIIERVNTLVPLPPLYQSVHFRAYNEDLGGVVMSASGYVDFNNIYWK